MSSTDKPLTDLQALSAKWRAEAEASLEKWPRGAILPSKKLRQCADELDALPSIPDHFEVELRQSIKRLYGAATATMPLSEIPQWLVNTVTALKQESERRLALPSIPDTRAWAQHKPGCMKNRTTMCRCGHDAAKHESFRNPLDYCNGDRNGCSCRKFIQDKVSGTCTCGLDAALSPPVADRMTKDETKDV